MPTNLENQNTEYKEKYNEKVLQTIAAFANTEGGIVSVGVSDDNTLKGIELTSKELKKITEQIINKLGIHPSISYENNILKIEVKKSMIPISCNGKYYKRVGNTTREMQSEELKAFFTKDSNWDSLTGDYSFEEIDLDVVKNFIGMATKTGRLRIFDANESYQETLERLKLILNGKLTNAAMLLFGKDPRKYFLNAIVRVGRFKGEATIIGDRVIEGNLFKQLFESEEAIKNFINVRYEITGKLQRDEIWDYPLDAIREILVNALVHRDYFKHNVQTQIKVFDDYLWCFTIGGLPQGITLDQLKIAHSSVARNPLIIDIFYLAGLVEEFGSGIQRINNAFENAGLPQPEFIDNSGSFTVIFKKDVYTPEKLKQLGLNERQIKAIYYMNENKKITNKEYQELNKTNNVTAFRDFEELLTKRLIQKQGRGRSVSYKLIITFVT